MAVSAKTLIIASGAVTALRRQRGHCRGRGRPVRRESYVPLATSIFLADSFLVIFSPTEIVRMPSR